ncbi:MAG TPA: FtsX-like permease family protein [Marmoricola sp.]|nr:FtsX-like permease family protein [Marmoricola sp.]
MTVLRMALRRAATDLVPLVALLVLLGTTAALAAAAPRLHNRTADEALGATLDDAPLAARELTVRSTNDNALNQLAIIDDQVTSSLSDPLAAVVGEPSFGVVTPRYETFRWPSGELFRPRPYAWLKIRYQTELLDEVRWVRGDAPEKIGTATVDGTQTGAELPRLEVALDARVAKQLDMSVGDEVLLEPLQGQLGRGGPVLVAVSGLFTPLHPDDVAWSFDPLTRSPGRETTSQGELLALYANALVSDPKAVKAAAATLDFEWHYPVRTEALDAENAAEVLAGIERFATQGFALESAQRVFLGRVPDYVADSGLREVLGDYLSEATTAEAVVSMVLAGLLLVALLVVGFAARLLGQRRAGAHALLRARGASWPQLLGVQAVEALCVAVPAALLGYALVVVAVPARPSPTSVVLVVALAGFAVVQTVLAARQEAGRRSEDSGRGSARWRWRELVEALVLLAAVGGVALVRQRGVGGDPLQGVDPLIAAVPPLVALAAGLVALRCYRWLSRPALRAVGRRRGAVGVVSLAAAAPKAGVTSVVVVVLLAGLAFSVFASAITSTIRDGQAQAAYDAVGADFRLDSPGFSEEQVAKIASVDGVSNAAPAVVLPSVPVSGDATGVQDVAFVAVDTAAYPAVASAASTGEVPSLTGLAEEPSGEAVLRVLVSPAVLEAGDGLTLGLGSGIGDVPVEVVGTIDGFPLTRDSDAVVADLGVLQESEGGTLRATSVLVSGDAGVGERLIETVEAWDAGVTVTDRRARLAGTRTLPFVGSTVDTFRLGFAAVAAYGLAAVVLFLLLTGEARVRLLATLRSLGMSRRQTRAVAGLELAPMVVLAVLAGTAVGVGLAYLLIPAVELVPFTGGFTSPDPVVSPGVLAVLALAVLGLVAAALLGVTAFANRRRAGDLLRTGADE